MTNFFALAESQVKHYQNNNVPYVGYAWRNRLSDSGGCAVYRLDTVALKHGREANWPEPSGRFLPEGAPLKIGDVGVRKVLKVAEKLKRNIHNDVQIYQG